MIENKIAKWNSLGMKRVGAYVLSQEVKIPPFSLRNVT